MCFLYVPALKGDDCVALSPKQQVFCEEYLIDLNATQAAIRAGYSVKTADVQSSRLLSKVKIQEEIGRLRALRSKRTGVTADRVIQELAKIAFLNPDALIDADDATIRNDATLEDKAAISGIKVKAIPTKDGIGYEREIKLADKTKALELLGKHLGMFVDKTDVSIAQPIVISGGDALED